MLQKQTSEVFLKKRRPYEMFSLLKYSWDNFLELQYIGRCNMLYFIVGASMALKCYICTGFADHGYAKPTGDPKDCPTTLFTLRKL